MSHLRRAVLTILFGVAANTALGGGVSVLFVGNSLTQVNDLPSVFKQFAAESPLHLDVEVDSITPGGAFLYDHWKHGQALALLRAKHPKFLVLQGQSTEPLSAPQNFAYYAGLFKTEADRVGATTILFATWARPAADPYYKDPTSGGSPAEMQSRLDSAYALVAKNIGATLAPVGIAWERARQVAPGIRLLDGTQHPTPAGTYLAAAVLCRVICHASAATSTYDDSLPHGTAKTLRDIADQVPVATQ